MSRNLITTNHCPPIPDRRFDWSAHWDGEEEHSGWVGWGSTEQEAIDDLKRLDREREESEMTDEQWLAEHGGDYV
jgi:hypothetical protein